MNQREDFEAWATTQHIDVTRDGFGGYMSQCTESAFEGWEAALAQKEALISKLEITETLVQARDAMSPMRGLLNFDQTIDRINKTITQTETDARNIRVTKTGNEAQQEQCPADAGETMEAVGYVYWSKGHAEGAIDVQNLSPGTPLYTIPPSNRAVLRQALEALDDTRYVSKYTHIVDAIAAIREVLK